MSLYISSAETEVFAHSSSNRAERRHKKPGETWDMEDGKQRMGAILLLNEKGPRLRADEAVQS